MALAQNRHEDQWRRLEDLDMNLLNYAHLIFDKGAKNIRWREDSLFSKCCWESGYWPAETETRSMTITSVWIKDLNIRPKPLKLVQERAGNTLEAIGIGKDFLSRTQVAQTTHRVGENLC
jgi:hypothetical protein